MNLNSIPMPRPFHFSTCLICGAAALEADITERTFAFQCHRCGGYDITAAAIVAINRMSRELRAAWLKHAWQSTPPTRSVPLLERSNEPQCERTANS
jgi:hypothetical protein